LEIKVGRGASGQIDVIGLERHMVTPKEVVEEKETADGSVSSEGSTPESDEMDESDVTGVNTKGGAITSDDSLRTSVETMEYSLNIPLENEEIVKENEEITDRQPSGDGIEATQATHPTQRIVHNKHLEELNQEGQEGEGGCYDDDGGDCGSHIGISTSSKWCKSNCVCEN
jgi:hypothetical protein